MAPQLVALTDGPNIPLDKPILLIGRHQECDIQIPSRKISRRHCCIAQVNDHLVVRDLGSTNGIRVNGVRVLEGLLSTGDELVIGNFKYEVRLIVAAPQPPRRDKKIDPLAIPKMELEENPPMALDASGEVPFPLAEVVLPVRQSVPPPPPPPPPPPSPIPQAAGTMDDGSQAVMPESMSLEPISDEYSLPFDGKDAPKRE